MAVCKQRIPLLVIAGPTASGKTGLAVAVAKELKGEVISADSMQVYRDLSVSTARPTEEETEGVPHHLVGFLPIGERYHVARYAEDARAAIAEVNGRGKLPILCGGTGLYIQAVTENIAFSEEDTALTSKLRTQLRQELEQTGGEAMRQRLAALDPETAARLHPNDHGRIIRALETVLATGVPISEWIRRSKETPSPYDAVTVLLDFHDRQKLYARIDRRVDEMVKRGLLKEAEWLYSVRQENDLTSLQAIGCKELFPCFEGTLSFEEGIANVKKSTRNYAKRQLSWFRRIQAHNLYVDEFGDGKELAGASLDLIRKEW